METRFHWLAESGLYWVRREVHAMEDYQLRREDRQIVSSGKALTFMRDTMRLSGGKTEYWDFVHHNRGGGACVVPVLPDGRILMIRQFRPAVDRETLELPAGVRNPEDSDTSATAKRELREETGYSCGRIRKLLSIDTAVAWCDECTDIYLAQDLVLEGRQVLDAAEEIRFEAWELDDLLRRISEGTIRDAKTAAGILAYAVDCQKASPQDR